MLRQAALQVCLEVHHRLQPHRQTDQAVAGDNVGLLLDGVGRDDVAPGNVVRGE